MIRLQHQARRLSDEMDIQRRKINSQRFLAERAVISPGGLVLMLDRFLGANIDLDMFAERGCTSVEVRIRHPAFENIDRTPLLVRIRPEDSDLIGLALGASLQEQADPQQEAIAGLTVAGWMEVDASLHVLARHLAFVMMQRVNAAHQVRVIRLSDRRILEFLWNILSLAQQASLLGPISAWHVIDRCGAVRSLCCPAADRRNKTVRQGLGLNPAQWIQLEQCQQVQEMARGWMSMVEALPPDYFNQLRAALGAAKGLGLTANQDIQLLAAYILQVHPLLASHARVIGLVKRSIIEKSPLVDVLAEIPDPEGWKQLKNELGSAKSW